jgi:SAM-dependent methyltransferase
MENLEKMYLKPSFGLRSIDTFGVRRGIVDSLTHALPNFHGKVLDVGCGYMPYKPLIMSAPSQANAYIGMDLAGNHYQPPDLIWDGNTIPLEDGTINTAFATEVLEHCADPARIVSEIFRVLAPDGFFFFTVPFLWPLHEIPHDHFRYTPFSLERLLQNAGFRDSTVKAHGGWDASLAQMLGLWVKRRPMPWWARGLAVVAAAPLVYVLSRRDAPKDFTQSVMITGLSGVAFKRAGMPDHA